MCIRDRLYTGTEQYEAAVEEFEGILETDEGVAAFEAGELEEPDPADYGFYHVGVPVVVGGWLESIGAAPWVQSLVLDGIIAGVGAVIGFIPQLIVLFILLGFLEGCGYMAQMCIRDRGCGSGYRRAGCRPSRGHCARRHRRERAVVFRGMRGF